MHTPAKASLKRLTIYMLLAMIRVTTKRIYQWPRQLWHGELENCPPENNNLYKFLSKWVHLGLAELRYRDCCPFRFV